MGGGGPVQMPNPAMDKLKLEHEQKMLRIEREKAELDLKRYEAEVEAQLKEIEREETLAKEEHDTAMKEEEAKQSKFEEEMNGGKPAGEEKSAGTEKSDSTEKPEGVVTRTSADGDISDIESDKESVSSESRVMRSEGRDPEEMSDIESDTDETSIKLTLGDDGKWDADIENVPESWLPAGLRTGSEGARQTEEAPLFGDSNGDRFKPVVSF